MTRMRVAVPMVVWLRWSWPVWPRSPTNQPTPPSRHQLPPSQPPFCVCYCCLSGGTAIAYTVEEHLLKRQAKEWSAADLLHGTPEYEAAMYEYENGRTNMEIEQLRSEVTEGAHATMHARLQNPPPTTLNQQQHFIGRRAAPCRCGPVDPTRLCAQHWRTAGGSSRRATTRSTGRGWHSGCRHATRRHWQ